MTVGQTQNWVSFGLGASPIYFDGQRYGMDYDGAKEASYVVSCYGEKMTIFMNIVMKDDRIVGGYMENTKTETGFIMASSFTNRHPSIQSWIKVQ